MMVVSTVWCHLLLVIVALPIMTVWYDSLLIVRSGFKPKSIRLYGILKRIFYGLFELLMHLDI